MPVLDAAALIDDRVEAVRAFHARLGQERAELDVSGGVDSAVMLALLSRALGPGNVTAVFVSIHSAEVFARRAQAAAEVAGVPLVMLDVSDVFDQLTAAMLAGLATIGHDEQAVRARMAADPAVLGSLRSCLRAPIGRGMNRFSGGGIRHGTGNECEDRFLRFYQKGGDGEVDTNPLAMLSKGEVFQLARALGVPRQIRTATPSPDLHGVGEQHTDEAELAALSGVSWTYSRVDAESGEYTRVGSIERVSRLLDRHAELVADEREPDWVALVASARRVEFASVLEEDADLRALLQSARRWEAATRHKANPNCPTLGSRAELLDAGVLTDDLPRLA